MAGDVGRQITEMILRVSPGRVFLDQFAQQPRQRPQPRPARSRGGCCEIVPVPRAPASSAASPIRYFPRSTSAEGRKAAARRRAAGAIRHAGASSGVPRDQAITRPRHHRSPRSSDRAGARFGCRHNSDGRATQHRPQQRRRRPTTINVASSGPTCGDSANIAPNASASNAAPAAVAATPPHIAARLAPWERQFPARPGQREFGFRRCREIVDDIADISFRAERGRNDRTSVRRIAVTYAVKAGRAGSRRGVRICRCQGPVNRSSCP